jgi:hypothetical protein
MAALKTNHVQIQISGQGMNSWAYAINEKTYKKLRKGELDDSALAVVQDEAIGSELISWGLDSFAYPSPEFTIKVNGRKTAIKRIVHTYEGTTFDEEFEGLGEAGLKEKKVSIECSELDRVYLGEQIEKGVDSEQIKAFVFERIYFSSVVLKVEFDLPEAFNLQDLRLIKNDMDADTVLSRASYDLGIPDSIAEGEENAIVGVAYKEQRFLFETTSTGGAHLPLLVVKKHRGTWKIDENLKI